MNLEEKIDRYQNLHNMRNNIGKMEVSLEDFISQYNTLAGELGEKSYSLNRRAKKEDIEGLRDDIMALCTRPQSMADITRQLSALQNEQTVRAQVRSLLVKRQLYKIGSRGPGVEYMVRTHDTQ